eukprot:scaffold2712_cov21-Phaeocystis_antarctica.AAC.1
MGVRGRGSLHRFGTRLARGLHRLGTRLCTAAVGEVCSDPAVCGGCRWRRLGGGCTMVVQHRHARCGAAGAGAAQQLRRGAAAGSRGARGQQRQTGRGRAWVGSVG